MEDIAILKVEENFNIAIQNLNNNMNLYNKIEDNEAIKNDFKNILNTTRTQENLLILSQSRQKSAKDLIGSIKNTMEKHNNFNGQLNQIKENEEKTVKYEKRIAGEYELYKMIFNAIINDDYVTIHHKTKELKINKDMSPHEFWNNVKELYE
ncbi:hypothetical protein A3Q56_03708 [Intoshia linei]|uniref:Uncharacterized protein n=1 Tax=Intoshia linei TaxID=1819745 RepID=A0A177B2S2_9BILA|nr:hypothetical protein A3Q56_03708 [Intoshia linei]